MLIVTFAVILNCVKGSNASAIVNRVTKGSGVSIASSDDDRKMASCSSGGNPIWDLDLDFVFIQNAQFYAAFRLRQPWPLSGADAGLEQSIFSLRHLALAIWPSSVEAQPLCVAPSLPDFALQTLHDLGRSSASSPVSKSVAWMILFLGCSGGI